MPDVVHGAGAASESARDPAGSEGPAAAAVAGPAASAVAVWGPRGEPAPAAGTAAAAGLTEERSTAASTAMEAQSASEARWCAPEAQPQAAVAVLFQPSKTHASTHAPESADRHSHALLSEIRSLPERLESWPGLAALSRQGRNCCRRTERFAAGSRRGVRAGAPLEATACG